MVTASLFVNQHTLDGSGRILSNYTRRFSEHDSSNHTVVGWEVCTSEGKHAGSSIETEGSDLSLRNGVVVITSHVVANGWFTIDSDDDLRFGLVSSQPLERNWLIEDVVSERNCSVGSVSNVVTKELGGV
jgi:hypothetical protein